MHKKLAAGLAAGVVAAVGFAAPAQAISDSTADLYILHAVPDLPVDVWVNGEVLLEDFTPGTLTDAVDLPAGDYEVVITAVDDPITSPAIGPVTLPLAAGTSYTAVAHLAEDGTPTATLFTNDLATLPAGEGRLTVRHVAAAPAVDVLANGAVAFSNLSNPNEAKANLPAGTIEAAVAAAGTTDPVIGPAPVDVQEGVNTIVYAWGSLEDENLDLAVQTIGGLHSTPDGVNSGTAGLAADPDPASVAVGVSAVLALMAVVGIAIVRARRVESAR
ncbi:hypothetical protein M2152_000841 [Microbacteriaceae bacterium SG_E_30_P1]|uniref:DUF4397 domain-containing protein n=1 Tax=Antiquaquibacter oligotrophicus TaxID=2880260 RepID=A0ABT6KKX9_9MICO|nr:DUF4397 domain-containing protein [Antiquaquibacter oligotrophicus]MDH6180659.1 hypothetical protein [Antiquaquibacter oligotrophicus]UDF13613.1 DUF4397 domain-containing protein [Antiquaquibacter oligotrophicus]